MSITFTNGNPSETPGHAPPTETPGHTVKPSKPSPPKANPQLHILQTQRKRIEQQINRIQGKPQGKSMASLVRRLASTILAADDPNKDPEELVRQISPLIKNKLFIRSIQENKTELVPNQTKSVGGKILALYRVMLRREYPLDPDHIDRLKRNKDFFSYLEWSSEGVCIYLWNEYIAPAAAGGATPAPGAM